MTKSETAQSQLMKVASNSTKVHFEIETNPVSSKKSLLGLHRVHDEEGKILEWDKETNTYRGTPAYLIDEEGNTVYKEATITIYLNHIYKNHDKLKYLRSDYGSTLNEILVDVTAHETDHNLNPNSINAVIENQKGNNTGFDVEAPAYLLQEKVYKEVKQNRGK